MKRYVFCLFLFVGVSISCLIAGAAAARYARLGGAEVQTEEASAETVLESKEVVNREEVRHEIETETKAEEYYLVSEAGFLLVFARDMRTICLYTHIPITDFPYEEQERLREGIWFRDMMEIFQYLESYTS